MLDKNERSLLYPNQSLSFSSAGPGASHLQNTDFTPSSYFTNMNILEETSTKRKLMNLDSKNHPAVPSVCYGNNQYYDKDKFSAGQQADIDTINKVLFSNPRQPHFQHKESSFLPETYKEDVSNLRNTDHIGFHSEYSYDLVRTFLHAQDNIYLGKQDETAIVHANRSLVERTLPVNASLNSERLTETNDGFSANMDEQNKPTNRRVSPVISEKIWEGSLKLNASTTVSAVAFFKSGERVQDLNWPVNIEIKGKVRLHAFEKFIQELPRSRNRALMVISLCWKLGSCRTGLAGMMEVARGYRESEKVGFAQIPPGIDLYVCPRSDIIITILAKYGFFKGMAAVEEDQDSLIGCVVWRRSQSSTNHVSKDTVGKKTLMEDQPLNSTGPSIQEMNSPAMEARECEKKQVMQSEIEHKESLDLPGSDARSVVFENNASLSTSDSHSGIFHCSSVQTLTSSIPYSCPLVPALSLLRDNMNPADIIPVTQNSGTDESVMVSGSWTQFVSPSQMAPVFMPRPLIPVDSSNFQFQPQLAQITHSGGGNDSKATQPALPGPPPLPLVLLHRLLQSNENEPKTGVNGAMLQDEIHIMQGTVTRGPTDVLEARTPLPQIHDTGDASKTDGKEEEGDDDDDDDLPEFDFNSACGEPEASISRFPGFTHQTHLPNASPLNENLSFEAPWSPDDPTPIATKTQSFEAFQHRSKPSLLPSKLLNSGEGFHLPENHGKFISEKTPSTEIYQLTSPPSCPKEAKDLSNNPNHGLGFERKRLWDDDDDDMPEWCPPDFDPPKQPPPSTTNSARLLSGRSLPPDTTASSSIRTLQNHDFQQRSHSGLLGPFPTSYAPADEFVRFRNPPKPPMRSHRRDSYRSHSGKSNRRLPPYTADTKRHRR